MSASSAISCQSIDIESFEDSPEALDIFHKVSEALRTGKRIIVVTGAGISVSSGIPVFLINFISLIIFDRILDLQVDFMRDLVLNLMLPEGLWNSVPNPITLQQIGKFQSAAKIFLMPAFSIQNRLDPSFTSLSLN